MTTETLTYIVHAQDRELTVLKGKVDGLNRSLDKGTSSAGRSASQSLQKTGRTAGRAGLIIGGAMAFAGGKALSMAAEFDQSLSIFQAVSGSTTEQMSKVREEAIKLGADIKLPATSAKDAAEAMTELAKGGLDVHTVMKATHGTLLLSAASGISNAEAAKVQVRALKAFNLEGTEANRIADLLAGAANSSTAEIQDMTDGFQNASASASMLGIPIEDLATSLALMADKGIKGAQAGIGVKVMLTRFVPLTKKATEAYKELGIVTEDGNNRLFNSKGHFVGMAKASKIFRTAMRGTTDEQKIATLQTIFGQDAQKAASIILLGGAKSWDKMKKGVTEQGAAAKAAQARNKGLKGAMDAFKSTAETLAIIIGTVLMPAADAFLRKFLIPGVTWLGKHKTLTMILGGVILALAFGLVAFSIAVKVYTFVTAEATASTWKWTVALLSNPIFWVIIGLIALGVAMIVLWKKSETFRAIVNKLWDALKAVGSWIAEWAPKIAGWLVTAFKWTPLGLLITHLGDLWGIFKSVASWIGEWAVRIAGWIKDAFNESPIGRLFGKLDEGWGMLKRFAAWLSDKAGTIFEKFKDALQPVVDAFNKIKAAVKWLLDHMPEFEKAGQGMIIGTVEIPGSNRDGGRPRGGGAGDSRFTPKIWDEMSMVRSMGMSIGPSSSGRNYGDHGRSPSHAIDIYGTQSQMSLVANMLYGRSGSKDVFYGYHNSWQDNGRMVGGWGGNEDIRNTHLDHVHYSVFDQGGYLPPGLTLALNKTGKPERVIGPREDVGRAIIFEAGAIVVEGSVTSERDLVRTIHEGLARAGRQNAGTRL